jgi:hypothetical protein
MQETESGESLSEVPAGSFGFTPSEFLAYPFAYTPLEKVPIDAHGHYYGALETHKVADGHSEVLVFVGPETLERIRHGLHEGEKLTIYTDAWKEASNLVTIPIARIQCERNRTLSPDKGDPTYHLCALDCQVN